MVSLSEGVDWTNGLRLYRWVTVAVFATGAALFITSLVDPRLPIQIVQFFFPDEPGDVASLLRISEQTVMVLYGILFIGVSAFLYVLEDYIQLDESYAARWNNRVTLQLFTIISFILTFLAVRAIVAISGVVGPATTGTADGIPVIQIVLPGFRVHHYVFGVLILIFICYRLLFYEHNSKKVMAILYGIGLGLFIDEIGMILTQGNYFAFSTYVFATIFGAVFLLGIHWNIRQEE